MVVNSGIFLFEIAVDKLNSLVKCTHFIVETEFMGVFSLEIKCFKETCGPLPNLTNQINKKRAIKKPQFKITEKRKLNVKMQPPFKNTGQSAMFSSNSDFLIQHMKKYPLILSLWSKKVNKDYIGVGILPWNPIFIDFLRQINNCKDLSPVFLRENFNIFLENTDKRVAKIDLRVKSTFITNNLIPRIIALIENPSIQNGRTEDNTNVNDPSNYESHRYSYSISMERVYMVYYFTVEYNFEKDPSSKEPSTNDPTSVDTSTNGSSRPSSSGAPSSKQTSSKSPSTEGSSESLQSDNYAKFPNCPPTCPILKMAENAAVCSKAICALPQVGLPKDDSSDSKCTGPVCKSKLVFPPSPADSNIVIKFNEIYNPCCVKSCDISERVKEFIAGNYKRDQSRKKCREMEDTRDPCYCDCACTFKFSSKTTYCAICGGYECIGDDTRDLPDYARPHPCPVYHKLYDKNRIKVKSPWPDEEEKQVVPVPKLSKTTASKSAEKTAVAIKVMKPNTEKDGKDKEVGQQIKKKKKQETKKVGKFTANTASDPTQPQVDKKKSDVNKYTYPPVPKHMGWNWLAKDIPGMEVRPKWRPGAANKILVRRYRSLMEGSDMFAKKKRAQQQRKKKIEMKPTLVVTKQDGGEFTVQMEVFKKYSKERLLYQYPYDEKPPLIYTIGKTAAEQNKLQRQRDRRARRDTRRKSRLLQSTFRDKCQEICLKAYNQAIGLQGLPNPNNPECPCAAEANPSISPAIDSCSCSDDETISSSDTDHDEWTIEFTPPMANWDAKAKHPPMTESDETQYNYLDYKVKLLDRSGNPVPRYFKSHEGKQECSDLGGFWGPGHVWLEINKDGYIGPDERWVPMNFFGPDGMSYSAEEGFFTDNTGQVLKLGVDGYIDKDLKWVWYMKMKPNKKSITSGEDTVKCTTDVAGKKKFGGKPITTGPPPGAGHKGTGDKAAGEKGTNEKSRDKKVVVVPTPKQGSAAKKKLINRQHNPVVMNVTVSRNINRVPQIQKDQKPYVDPKTLSKYQEIMGEFQIYDEYLEMKSPPKTNRASNTSRIKPTHSVMRDTLKNMASVTNVTTSYGQTVNKTTPSLLLTDGTRSGAHKKNVNGIYLNRVVNNL